MRRLAFCLTMAAVTAACAVPLPFPPPAPAPGAGSAPTDVIADEVLERVNRYRTGEGLPRLVNDPFLTRLAQEHSDRMAAGAYPFGHDGFDDRADRARYALGVSGMSENVAMNNHPPADVARVVVDGWIRSPGHLRNLSGDFELSGVGVARSRAGDTYVTQLYAVR